LGIVEITRTKGWKRNHLQEFIAYEKVLNLPKEKKTFE
jgi:hypothetical protein